MNMLKSVERKLEGLVEGLFGRAFKASVQPVELAHKLAKEMGDHKTLGVASVYVPNEYEIYLGHDDHEKLSALGDALKAELANYLTAFARREGWTMVAAPRIDLLEDADLRLGEFGIATRTVAAPSDAVGAPMGASAGAERGRRRGRHAARRRARGGAGRGRPVPGADGALRASRRGDGALRAPRPGRRRRAHRRGHRHRSQPALRHRAHRPERLAAARRGPAQRTPGRRSATSTRRTARA